MHHAAILPNATVRGEHVVDGRIHHLLAHSLGIIGASRLNGIQILKRAGVDTCMNHGWSCTGFFHEAVRPGASLIVHIPVPAGGQLKALRGFGAKGMNITQENNKAGNGLARLSDTKFCGRGNGVSGICTGVCQSDNIRT